ncbi:MAG TPA: 50S ribosomal protein L10 [Acidobacteriota bacterium]|nr:50S ribosomal protein L10 [Acidobacteriota bacterium]HMZ81738.1 50S ribosomal protein L10 [Acidobacteriota bacterium]HNB69720.1 50S ribosomal protein L10 [Acidobacteriota bacterium]HND19962.1 50S ribosomal protein L10 [Acidobacteriota bacterium]HNG91543.1 50S ribosomal protein L10 [Acidobacteriota bacterium]
MNRTEKNQELEVLTKSFQSTPHAFLVGFQGLTVGVDTNLRAEMRKANITYKVVKNTLARRAAKGTALEVVEKNFVGPTAVAIHPEDPVTTAKLLQKFFKENPKFVFKAAVVEGRAIQVTELDELANMPSREELLSKLLFVLNSGAQRLASVTNGVARNLAIVLNQIHEQRANAENPPAAE